MISPICVKVIDLFFLQKKSLKQLSLRLLDSCREEGIRTLDTVTRILPFQGSSFNHSDTSLFEIAKIE